MRIRSGFYEAKRREIAGLFRPPEWNVQEGPPLFYLAKFHVLPAIAGQANVFLGLKAPTPWPFL